MNTEKELNWTGPCSTQTGGDSALTQRNRGLRIGDGQRNRGKESGNGLLKVWQVDWSCVRTKEGRKDVIGGCLSEDE